MFPDRHRPFHRTVVNPNQAIRSTPVIEPIIDLDDCYYNEEKDTDIASLTSSMSNTDVESIDYHAVYARYVFIATVEGQISVIQDDKLTLLDDSNAYWWLVRIIKTSEVGYIPAEGIETPLERLARFNKIRNTQVNYISEPNKPTHRTKKKQVSISNTISIQSMIIISNAYDTHLSESFEVSEYDITSPISSTGVQQSTILPTHHTRQSNYDLSRDLAHHFLQHHAKTLTPRPSSTPKIQRRGIRQFISRPNRSSILPAPVPLTSCSTPISQPQKECLSVLRVFAGNISVKATFNSVLVDESTTATELLSLALERFRLSQQEQGDGVEYYITVKVLDGDEITLSPQDKPLAMFHSLNTHLTTPMPSLTHIRSKVQLTRIGVATSDTTMNHNTINNDASNDDKHLTSFGENSVIRFLLNKRIKRINEQDGKLRIKIAYYSNNTPLKLTLPTPTISSRFSHLRHLPYSRKTSPTPSTNSCPLPPQPPLLDRMEKLVAVSGNLRIFDLTCLALEKFHLQQGSVAYSSRNDMLDKYGMTLVRQDKEYVLHGNRTIMDILTDVWLNPQQRKDDGSILFVLRKMQSRVLPLDEKQEVEEVHESVYPSDLSLTSSRSSSTLSLNSPEDTTLTTDDLIHRIDRTLSSLEKCTSVTCGSYKSVLVNTSSQLAENRSSFGV